VIAATKKAAVGIVIVLAGAGLRDPLAAQSSRATIAPVVTNCTLMLGRPATGSAAPPGRQSAQETAAVPSGAGGSRASKTLAELSERLRTSFNLATMEFSASISAALSLKQEASVAGTGGFRLLIVPTAIGSGEVTYRVRVLQGDRVVLDKAMVVERGHRTMFARRTFSDGETAFVVIEIPQAGEQVASAPQDRPELPAFRAGVTLVPLDVHVVDRNGRLVTDVRQEEFAVFEDGAPQKISQFLAHTVQQPVDAGADVLLRQAPGDAISLDKNRVFLIVLGRGRLQQAFNGLDALITFVGQLMPQDRVGVIAWDHATDLTTDREGIIRLLARLKSAQEQIEHQVQQMTGALMGSSNRWIPAEVQRRIDAMFDEPGLPRSRQIPSFGGPGFYEINDEMRTNLWDLFKNRATSLARDRILDDDIPAQVMRTLERWPLAAAGSGWGSGEFGSNPGRTGGGMNTASLEQIFAGIEFLRYLAGEKHLVFVTERNFTLPRTEYEKAIGALANDAGVTIDTVQTGGLGGDMDHSSLKVIAALTGGISSVFRYPREFADRLHQLTSFKYMVAYHPSNAVQDGRYRQVEVKVNRRDVYVLFRQGYYASDVLVPSERRAFVSQRRILAAGQASDRITDIRLVVKVAGPRPGTGGSAEATITGTIDANRIAFAKAADRYTSTLDLAAFCSDAKEKLLGEAWQKINLDLTEATYQRVKREGIAYAIRVPVKAAPRWSKVIVYDYASDLLGSVVTQIR